MTVLELAARLNLSVVSEADDREISGVYCCDLLSVVMGQAPADSAWVTVIGNVNAVAVANLADVACVVLAGGGSFDPGALAAASGKTLLLCSGLPVYETARAIGDLL